MIGNYDYDHKMYLEANKNVLHGELFGLTLHQNFQLSLIHKNLIIF